MDLLDLLREQEHAVDPRADYVHVMLPSMRYACGGCICGCAGPRGKSVFGVGRDSDWDRVTCPDCRAPGRRAIRRLTHVQQKPVNHQCTDPAECDWLNTPEETTAP